jgi:hypothetical protein
MRVADDLAILRIGMDEKVAIEPCRFDRGGRLPGREGSSWPVRAAYDIRKAAAVSEDGGAVDSPLATWCGALLSSVGPPESLDLLLSLTFSLSRSIPPRAFNVSAKGAVLSALIPKHSEQLFHASPAYP